MSIIWQPGVQCVCINDNWPSAVRGVPLPSNHPVKGQIYDVVWVDARRNRAFLVLQQCGDRYNWRSDYFRPVKKTDISPLTALLESKPTIVGVDEDIFEVFCDEVET